MRVPGLGAVLVLIDSPGPVALVGWPGRGAGSARPAGSPGGCGAWRVDDGFANTDAPTPPGRGSAWPSRAGEVRYLRASRPVRGDVPLSERKVCYLRRREMLRGDVPGARRAPAPRPARTSPQPRRPQLETGSHRRTSAHPPRRARRRACPGPGRGPRGKPPVAPAEVDPGSRRRPLPRWTREAAGRPRRGGPEKPPAAAAEVDAGSRRQAAPTCTRENRPHPARRPDARTPSRTGARQAPRGGSQRISLRSMNRIASRQATSANTSRKARWPRSATVSRPNTT
jgi:hypothetical protein